MKIPSPYLCDGCGKPKDAANRWWIRHPQPLVFMLSAWGNGASSDDEGVEHLCSESCANKALSKWMGQYAKLGEIAKEAKSESVEVVA